MENVNLEKADIFSLGLVLIRCITGCGESKISMANEGKDQLNETL